MRTLWTHKIATLIYLEILFKERCCSPHIGHNFILFIFNVNLFVLIGSNRFTILYWFCCTLTWICHGCTCVSHLEPPTTCLLMPSLLFIPVHQPRASCIMQWTWTGNLFDKWYYTGFNVIIPNHPTLALSQSPKDCSIHLCIFCCLAYRVIATIFLNSTYMR